jgi:hypothetical protein
MTVGRQRHAPAALPMGKTRYPLLGRLGGPQGRCGRARKISPPPGFDPRTLQPVASRYTDWAIPAHFRNEYQQIFGAIVQYLVDRASSCPGILHIWYNIYVQTHT